MINTLRPINPYRISTPFVRKQEEEEVEENEEDSNEEEPKYLNKMIHQHRYVDKGDHWLCPCGKRKLKLEDTEYEGVKMGIKGDGKKYTVRDHRIRFFYPNEWNKFYDYITKEEHKLLFEFLIQTGARINESLHARPYDFDYERNTVRLWKTKTRAALKERSGKPRTILLSSTFVKRVKRYIREKGLEEQSMEFLFPGVTKDVPITKQGVYQLFKRYLVRAEIKDPYNFSLHNIRKTHGNWLKAIGVDSGEICLRLGHDLNTFQKHYGSSSIFNNNDLNQIDVIFGDLYKNRRRFQ